jgi:hypothetical protein
MGRSESAPLVTFDVFNRLEHGMSYEQVCAAIGCNGHLLFRIGGVGGVPETAMYSWNGSGIVGANMNATFKDGKLTSKAQFGMDQSPPQSEPQPTIETNTRDTAAAGDELKS